VRIDSRTLASNATVETEVCIVGAGAAGITLALELAQQPFRVVLLESGGLEPDADTQALYQGTNVGQPYAPLQFARLRYFGGTTNHWSGWCRPFAPIDFEARDGIPHTGWPMRYAEVQPFYRRAFALLRLPHDDWATAFWADAEHPVLPLASNRVVTRIQQQLRHEGQRVRFGQSYGDRVEQAPNIRLYLHANVTEFETDPTGRSITRVHVACLSGVRFSVRAKYFILATGGIENARLLLLSNRRHRRGLGNQHDMVGRFFQDRAALLAGIFKPSNPQLPLRLYQFHRAKQSNIYGSLELSADVRRREQMANVHLLLEPIYEAAYARAVESRGVHSMRHLLGSLWRGTVPDDFGQHVRNVAADLDDLAVHTYGRLRYGLDYPVDHVRLRAGLDPVPNPDSRVTLGTEVDQLGQRRIQLDWRLTAAERTSLYRTVEIVGIELARAGLGRVQLKIDDSAAWPSDVGWVCHHIGTTRMSDHPAQGVVDRNCRVHSIHNLFVAGSSVFPTAGSGTPTLLIVALAIRLADHLKRQLR
jgi:choline dehydrogenase-like flavoprotein